MSIKESIKDILVTDIFVEIPIPDMDEDDNLREVFGLDSIGFVELRVQCEERFGVVIGDDDFIPDNFASIRTVAALVERLSTAALTANPR
jgi:acyl carrier protein